MPVAVEFARNPESLKFDYATVPTPKTRPDKVEFQFPPNSMDHAEDMSASLHADIMEIEVQLKDPVRMAAEDYELWRSKALAARSIKTTQRAKIKNWIKRQRVVEQAAKKQELSNGVGLLIDRARKLLHSLAADGVEFTEEEQAVVDDLDTYCVS